jgi:hypothetical protein
MAEMGQPGGKGGAVVKDKLLRPVPLGYRFLENIVFFPKGQNLFFQFGKAYLCIYRLIHFDSSAGIVWHIEGIFSSIMDRA